MKIRRGVKQHLSTKEISEQELKMNELMYQKLRSMGSFRIDWDAVLEGINCKSLKRKKK